MINEAAFVLQEGIAGAEGIDAGMKLGCGQPLGPLALADLIGLDTMLAIMQVLYEGLAIRSTGRHLFCARWSRPAD